MMNPVINSQIGRVGPWRPAFLLSISMLIMTLSTVYWNEQNDKKFCKAPPFNSIKSPIVIATVGATIGNFIIQLVHISSQYESSRHRSSSLMILLMTFIQGCSQIASVTNVVTTGCEDSFGVRTSVFLWTEWMSTVPVMFYLTTIMGYDKLELTKEDRIIIWTSTLGLFCLYLLNFGRVPPIISNLLLMSANFLMTGALFWLCSSSYYAHLAAIKGEEGGPMASLDAEIKRRKLICSGFMTGSFVLFPLAYFLKVIDIIDHDTLFIAFFVLNFLSKGIFSTLLTESHSQILDPKTFLLFSEKKRMETVKQAFMQYIYLEIHVPLKSISLGLQILNESNQLCEADEKTINMLRDSGNLMTETLNDIFSLHKIEGGKMKLDMKPFYIADLIKSGRETFKNQLLAKGVKIFYEKAEDVSPLVFGDKKQIGHVFSRLVTNAIKFSPHDRQIQITVSHSTEQKGFITFSVRDYGAGIPENVSENLFRSVLDLPPENLRRGMGCLAICNDIIQLHGGIMGCTTYVKEKGIANSGGSDFFFSLLLPACVEEASSNSDKED